MMFAKFVIAISNTNPAAASSVRKSGRDCACNSSRNGVIAMSSLRAAG
jgi:hypothetical protein